ncbi:MAG: sugar phosphate isomerase/epimerase [Planctomycetes bacterium]|nr:sugar phosphate isomerase/epimerase [Planctomycetota bacterium]
MTALIACHTDSYGRLGPRRAIELLPEVGIQYVELPIRTPEEWQKVPAEPGLGPGATLRELDGLQRHIERHGLRVVSCDLTGGNPLEPDVVAAIKRKLDVASHFGVSVVVGSAGRAETPAERSKLDRNLMEIGDYAARRGLTYCFDVRPGVCQHHRLMLETIQRLEHSHLRLNFDPANLHYYNENVESEVALARVCHYVEHIHLKDTPGVFQEWSFPALGAGGAVDFFRIRDVMASIGFDGPYSIVVLGEEDEGLLPAATYQQRIAKSLEHLRECGYFD